MAWRRTPRSAPPLPQPRRPRAFMATVDSLPQPYEIVGLVHAASTVPVDVFPTTHLLDMLEDQAASMGADGVIGIKVSQVAVPGTSRERVLGRVTDHYGGMVVATALGTAVRLQSSTEPGQRHGCSRSQGR